jgi:hypothetical protein
MMSIAGGAASEDLLAGCLAMFRPVLLASIVVGCATGGPADNAIHIIDAPDDRADAPPGRDGDPGGRDADVDSSGHCTPVTDNLLVNGSFDDLPTGSGWTAKPIDTALPIITPDLGIAAQSPSNKAWMGGIAQTNAKDSLFQEVTVPVMTSQLVLIGFYEVRTTEVGSTVFDKATVSFVQPDGTVVETALSLDNAHPTTAWTPIDYTVTHDLSNQLIRLRFTTSNDSLNPTSFYFDTLVLNATHCP